MEEPGQESANQRGSERSRHAIRHLRAYLIALFALIAVSILLTALTTYLSIQAHLQGQFQNEVQRSQEMNQLQNQLVQPILFSRWMSRDQFLLDWVKNGEKDPAKVIQYLKDISSAWHYSAFVASSRTHKYYFSDGTIKPLDRGTADVGWFFDLLENRTESLADVGYNNGDASQPFLYIDIRMPDIEGQTSAYVGAAVELGRFQELLKAYRQTNGDELHFVNQQNMVILSTRPGIVNTPAEGYDWYKSIAQLPGATTDTTLSRDGHSLSISRKWISELGWRLYIEHDLNTSQKQVFTILLRTIGGITLLIIVVMLTMTFLLHLFKHDLDTAFSQIKSLKGIIPICCACKKIRDDRGYWRQLEQYIREHSEADLSHGICPDCARKLYPGLKATEQPPDPTNNDGP
jgi:hypothetical protein